LKLKFSENFSPKFTANKATTTTAGMSGAGAFTWRTAAAPNLPVSHVNWLLCHQERREHK